MSTAAHTVSFFSEPMCLPYWTAFTSPSQQKTILSYVPATLFFAFKNQAVHNNVSYWISSHGPQNVSTSVPLSRYSFKQYFKDSNKKKKAWYHLISCFLHMLHLWLARGILNIYQDNTANNILLHPLSYVTHHIPTALMGHPEVLS